MYLIFSTPLQSNSFRYLNCQEVFFFRFEASGFCYINDIVIGILELLKYHKRKVTHNHFSFLIFKLTMVRYVCLILFSTLSLVNIFAIFGVDLKFLVFFNTKNFELGILKIRKLRMKNYRNLYGQWTLNLNMFFEICIV